MHVKLSLLKQCLWIFILFSGTTVLAQNQVGKFFKLLPKEIGSEIYFGMDLASFKDHVGKSAQLVNDEYTFRIVYIQPTGLPDLTAIVYYFDADGTKPLYEIILVYTDENQPKNIAKKIFGKPNFNSTEWRFKNKGTPEIWSWIFKNKIVVVSRIPNTEWTDEWDTP